MAFKRLDIANFRNLVSVNLEFIVQGINFLYGENGSGKTSLLEALYYLSIGRSFRGTKTDRIINKNAEKFSIFTNIETDSGQIIPLGIERTQDGELSIRIAGKTANSIAEAASLLPVLLINSHCHHLLDLGPIFRRKFIDWGVFYFHKDFLRVWRQYERALKQRNAALRGQLSRNELEAWSNELINYGLQLDQCRYEYLNHLLPIITATFDELLALPGLEIGYQPGWNKVLSFQDALAQAEEKDRYLGYTQIGPHRADLKVLFNGIPAKDILSRGQQKLFVCAMMVAQGALLHQSANNRPIYLIDDLPSELDFKSRSKLLALLSKQNAQIFITAVEMADLMQASVKVFHVEHGEINRLPAPQTLNPIAE